MAAHSSLESLPPELPEFPVTAALLQRIRTEYSEIPGLKLTAAQAQRLWGLDRETSHAALATLVETAFLSRTLKGLFVMATTTRQGGRVALEPPSGHMPNRG